MSGGRFNYVNSHLKNEIFNYSDKPYNVFEDVEISELVWDVLNLIHDYDWYASGDSSEKEWLEDKMEFKNKWLYGNSEERVKAIIDNTLNNTKEELYKSFLHIYKEE